MNKYTDAMVAEMKNIGEFDFTKADAFAKAHGLSVRSVIAKVRALELPYKAKVPQAKSKAATPVRRKADMVAAINKELGLQLNSLEKMTSKDLEVLEARLLEA